MDPPEYFRDRHLRSLALPDNKRVGRGVSILYPDRRSLVTQADSSPDSSQFTTRIKKKCAACSRVKKGHEQTFSPHSVGTIISSTVS